LVKNTFFSWQNTKKLNIYWFKEPKSSKLDCILKLSWYHTWTLASKDIKKANSLKEIIVNQDLEYYSSHSVLIKLLMTKKKPLN
jgi:hypothetical protein